MDMLGTRANADEAGRQRPECRKPLQKFDKNWERIAALGVSSGYNSAMNERLHCLDHARRPFPALLN